MAHIDFVISPEAHSSTWRHRKSTETWEKFHPGTVRGFAVHPDDENIVFACVGSHAKNWGGPSSGYLEKTTDGGQTWQRIKDEKGGDFSPWHIYIDPVKPEVMLMNTTYHWGAQGKPTGIMRSLDGGKTWRSIQANHNYHWSDCFVYGGVPGRVYTAWHNGGLMRLDNLYEPESAAKPVGQ